MPDAPSIASVVARTFIGDLLVTAVVLAIAVVSGLTLLYESKPAWGGWPDITTAFLWGLGLHQVGKVHIRRVKRPTS